MMTEPSKITRLLLDWRSGENQALGELLPMVQDNLRQLAGKYMRAENAGHTLQATALVNEAFLRLVDVKVGDLSDQLVRLPKLPKSRELYRNPQAYEVELCQLVDIHGAAVTVAVIQAKLKEIIWGLKTIASYMPDDLTFSVTAVAGGGFTATKHPAKVPFKVPLTVLEAVELKISNDVSIANAMCKGVLPK